MKKTGMKYIKLLLGDILSVLKDKDIIMLLLGGPVLLTLLFGGAYLNSYVNDIPIAVLDEDNSSISRMIVQQFEENDRFNVKYFVSSKEELMEIINSRKAYMGVYIPYNFSNDVSTSRSTEALVIVDGANLVVGNNAYATASSIIQTIAAGVNIKLIEAKGVSPQTAENMAMAFQFNDRTLYDPRMTYMNYVIFGFVAVFLQQVILSGVGISLVKTGDAAVGRNSFKVILRKIISCGFFGILSTFAAIGIVTTFFKVPIRGNVAEAFLMCVVFVMAISCPAILIAAIVRDKLKFTQIAYMLSLPTFVSCGYVWPQDQMPHTVSTIIKIFWPLINFARPFDELLFKGTSFSSFHTNILQMLLYIAFWMPVSIWVFKKRFSIGAVEHKDNADVINEPASKTI